MGVSREQHTGCPGRREGPRGPETSLKEIPGKRGHCEAGRRRGGADSSAPGSVHVERQHRCWAWGWQARGQGVWKAKVLG